MAAKPKTPEQIRDARLKKLADAVKAKQITAAEYRKGVEAARTTYSNAVKAASTMGRAQQMLAGASKLKTPLQTVGTVAKNVVLGGANVRQRAITAAVTAGVAGAAKLGRDMQKQNKGKVVPTSSVTKAEKALGQRMGNKTVAPKPTASRRRADSGDSARTPKPLTKAQQRGSMGLTGASYTVKKGDSLWKIAQDNKTTVAALLKANPTIAKRKEAGKVTIFSGSKVRIPGKK